MKLMVTCLFNSPYMQVESLEIEFKHHGPFNRMEIGEIKNQAQHAIMARYSPVSHFYLVGIIPIVDDKLETLMMTQRSIEDVE